MELIYSQWFRSSLFVAVAIFLAFLIHFIVRGSLTRIAKRTGSIFHDSLVRHGQGPARIIFPLIALMVVVPYLNLPPRSISPVRHVITLGLIASVAWLLIAMLDVFEDVATAALNVSVQDNLRARKVQTQVHVLHRIVAAVIVIVALSIMLVTFPSIREIGTSLLASAGLAGLVVGLAARPTLANLLAGLQIALTEPIRLDDVVIVEGEWGKVEEITTTYVVVRIWDLRRLIVPLSQFIEKPFQNWTRQTADLLGTVFVYTDYSVSVDSVRQKLLEILQLSGMWDGKVWGLQVTNATDHTMELRALMSAPDSSRAWDLRCHVREKLIEYLQNRYPQSLPQTRVRLQQVVTN
jgi:small-conductance mechanosensitive channel